MKDIEIVQVPKLTVVLPFRNDKHLPYLLERLEMQCANFPNTPDIEFMVVDSGSEDRDACSDICEKYGVRYLYHNSEYQVFSIGAARDYGARFAKGKAVSFLDVDCATPPAYWENLINFMKAMKISLHKKKFFVVPCLYLTQHGTKEFKNSNPDTRFREYFIKWHHGDKVYTENLAPCSSIMVVDRLHYMSVGGHRPEFRGHGFEDFELYHRLIAEEGVLPRPVDYYKDSKNWDISEYSGFRAMLSLLGRDALMAGLFVVHLWHPRPVKASFYQAGNMAANRQIWVDLFKDFDASGFHPLPLVDGNKDAEVVAFFGEERSNPFRIMKDIVPTIGNFKFLNEFDYLDDSANFIRDEWNFTVQELGITKICFTNPYGNEARIKIYNWCKETGFPFICMERGALPDSWFIDPSGFNADSSMYERHRWDREISTDRVCDTQAYIRDCLAGVLALEKQGARVGAEVLASRLQIGGKKVLFVPLQRPSDTVIKYFSGRVESVEEFCAVIDQVAKRLRSLGWIVLCKKHPLEVTSYPMQYARYVAEDTHFLDLMELADSVALINSGVGLYALMAEKPCYIFGDAFYQFDDLNIKIETLDVDDLVRKIVGKFSVNPESVVKFISYLKNEFYSYGIPKVHLRTEKDKSLRSITTGIDFYQINLPNLKSIKYIKPEVSKIANTMPLFEKFKSSILSVNAKSSASSAHSKAAHVHKTPEYNDAVKLYKDGAYERASKMFDEIAIVHKSQLAYRAAAECYMHLDRRVDAMGRLSIARTMLPRNKSLAKRFAEVRRPSLIRRLGVLPERPFDVRELV